MEVKTGKVSWLFPYAAMDMAYMEGWTHMKKGFCNAAAACLAKSSVVC